MSSNESKTEFTSPFHEENGSVRGGVMRAIHERLDHLLDTLQDSRWTLGGNSSGSNKVRAKFIKTALDGVVGAGKLPKDSREPSNFVDFTNLKPTASTKDIEALCMLAMERSYPCVCVHPGRIADCVRVFGASEKKGAPGTPAVATVVGFPLGTQLASQKAAETHLAVAEGATEIDMVLNVGRFLEGSDGLQAAFNDICAVKQACAGQASLKVIIECCYLDPEKECGQSVGKWLQSTSFTRIVDACLLCVLAGAEYVKTSTGFGTFGAFLPHVALMRAVVGNTLGVKAAGGIRSTETARAFVSAGATRLGTSTAV